MAFSKRTRDWKLIFCLVLGSVKDLSWKVAFDILLNGTVAAPKLKMAFWPLAGSAQTVIKISGLVLSSCRIASVSSAF